MDRWQYLMVLGACLVLTAPLEWLGAGVYRRPGGWCGRWLPVAAVFVVWDVLAIAAHVWTYNPRYMTGIELPPHFPIEEALFFLVIPVCGLLTYGAVMPCCHGRQRSRRHRRSSVVIGLGYTLPAAIAVLVVVILELAVLRTGLFRQAEPTGYPW